MAATALRKGGQIVPGYDGCDALYFHNTRPEAADDYVTLAHGVPAADDFTLQVWLKAPHGGYNGWCSPQEILPKEECLPFARYTAEQRNRCPVLLSNIPLFQDPRAGLMITLSQPRNYGTVYFMAEGQPEPVMLWGLRDIQDGRWHQLTVTAQRTGSLTAYVDGNMAKQADISAWAGRSIDADPLTVGADSLGTHGIGEGILADLTLIPGVLEPAEIRKGYYIGAIGVLAQEIAARGLADCPLYDANAAHALTASAKKAQAEASAADAEQTYRALKAEYEAFLLKTPKADFQFMLIADVHSDALENGRAGALRRGLHWAREQQMQAVLDCGDYSAYGRPAELDSYWNIMDEEWPDRPLFLAVGNHETLEYKSDELVRYHCGRLIRRGMVPEGYNMLYYEGEVNGYPVIVLSQYSDTYTVSGYNGLWVQAGEIKPEQIAFLEDRLDRCRDRELPVFLIIHNAVKPLLDQQTQGHSPDNMVLLKADALYDTLKGRKNVVLCTGHVHNGFGGGAGFYDMADGYHVIDTVGFRYNTYGYGIGVNDAPGPHHCGYFIYVYGKTIVMRAVDLAAHRWLTAYDQLIQLKE